MSKAAKICAICVNKAEDRKSGTPEWLRIKKSTALTITMNAETESFDYIADLDPTTEIKGYAPTIDQDLAVLPSEPDYQWFFEQYKKRPVGEDAHYDFLLIYLCDKQGSAYYAVKQEAVLTFTDFNSTDGVLDYNIGFCGTPEPGTATVSGDNYTFTAGASAVSTQSASTQSASTQSTSGGSKL